MSGTNHLSCRIENNVAAIYLQRPKQLNALNGELLEELSSTLTLLSENSDVSALIITSELAKSFCSGIDVSFMQALSNDEAARFMGKLALLFEQIMEFPYPTIAAVRGYAFGSGADLALACDIRVAGESVKIRFPGPRFGVVLGTRRLVHEVGPAKARLLALTNKTIQAREALEYGIVQEVTSDEACLEAARSMAQTVTGIPKHALQAIRQLCRVVESPDEERILAASLAETSVGHGNFSERFQQYLEKHVSK